jgi:uncharacterized membrane protein
LYSLLSNNLSMNKRKIYFRIFIFLLISAWCAGFSFKSLSGGSAVSLVSSPILNLFYHNVCHQQDQKLIVINGFPLLVCSRCTGIYLGALVTSVFVLVSFRNIKISDILFKFAIIILATDVIINNLFLINYNKLTAFFTGLFFGAVCFLIVISVFENYILNKSNYR